MDNTDTKVVLVLVDWNNVMFQARDVARMITKTSTTEVYNYCLLIEIIKVVRAHAGANKEVRVRVFTNSAGDLPTIAHVLSRHRDLDILIIEGAARARQRDSAQMGKAYDDEDPVDLALLAGARSELESPRVEEIILVSGDGGFTPSPEHNWVADKPWRLLVVADVYNPKAKLSFVAERLKRAAPEAPLIVDPKAVIFRQTSSYSYEEYDAEHFSRDPSAENVTRFLVDTVDTVKETLGEIHASADRYEQKELVTTVWRSLLLQWAPLGFRRQHVSQIVELLVVGTLAKHVGGALVEPRSKQALEQYAKTSGDMPAAQVVWKDGFDPLANANLPESKQDTT